MYCNLRRFPGVIGLFKTSPSGYFNTIHFKDFQYKKSPNGDAAFYSLDIVSKKLAIELFGSGISLVLNPDTGEGTDYLISSFPVTVECQWKILAYLRSFDLNNFSFTPQEFFELFLIIANVSEQQAVAKFLNTFTVPQNGTTLPLQQFVNDVNDFNLLQGIPQVTITVNQNTQLTDVVREFNAQTGKYTSMLAFGTYILNDDLSQAKTPLQLSTISVLTR